MPRPGPPRQLVALRLSPDVVQYLDAQAAAEGLKTESGEDNRSAMIRLMIAYASTHMPKGWRPKVQAATRTPQG